MFNCRALGLFCGTVLVGMLASWLVAAQAAAPGASTGLTVSGPGVREQQASIEVGQRLQLSVEPKLPGLKFESGNPGFFTVDEKGLVTGVHEGTSTLSVTSAGGARAELAVTVREKGVASAATKPASGAASRPAARVVSGIVLGNEGGEVEVGQVERVIAHVLPYQVIGSNPFSLSSSDPDKIAASNDTKVIEARSPGEATVTVATLDGKYKASVKYRVVAKAAAAEVKTYNIEPAKFGIVYDTATEEAAKANSAGLQAALRYTADNGFNRLLLEKGKVLYVEPKDTVHMVSNVQFDLNGSEIRLRPNDYQRYAAFVFGEKGAAKVLENASMVNGTVTGERDEKEKYLPKWNAIPATEGGCTIIFEEGRNNGIRNLTVRKSIGFNISSGLAAKGHGIRPFTQGTISVRNMEVGGFGSKGEPVESPGRIRTKKPLSVADLKTPYYQVGYPLGYMGYNYVNSRIYDAYYFDSNMQLLGSAQGLLRFRQYNLPQGTAFIHFAFYQDQVPANGNGDFNGAFAFVENRPMPLRNYMIDCTIEDNYSCGFAACGGQGWLIKGNTFRRNGGRMPGCDIDWEDGWEYMQGDLVENNTFESRTNVIVCAGVGMVFRANTLRGSSTWWGRSQHYSLVGNTFEAQAGSQAKVSLSSQSDIYCSGNRYKNVSFGYSRQHNKEPFVGTYDAIITGDTFENSPILSGQLGEMRQCTVSSGEKFVTLPGGRWIECNIKGGSYMAHGVFERTPLEDAAIRITPGQTLELRNSKLKDPSFSAGTECNGLVIEDCEIVVEKAGTLVTPNSMKEVAIRNTKIKLGEKSSPYVLFGGWNATGAATNVVLDKVSFQCPANFEGYLHKFAWNAPANDANHITYTATRTDLGRFRRTDEKGEKSNVVFKIGR